MIHTKALRPSSQRRLSRWARALQNRRVSAFHWRIVGDERLRSSVNRRFCAEFSRGNLPGDVIEVIERELGRGVEYRLAEVACKRIEKTEIYRERLQMLQEEQWRDILNRAWSQSLISLTDAAYWIAACRAPRDSGDEDLDRAARELVAKLQSGELVALGIPENCQSHKNIPIEEILTATRDGASIFGESVFGDAQRLVWAIISGEDRDTIESRTSVHWRRVSIKRTDMLRTWPKMLGKATFPTESPTTIAVADFAEDPLAAYKTGTQGRPSPIQFVEREAERRRAFGEALEKVSEEADYLHKWCACEHPNAVTPTPKTIENKVRAAHRNWKASR